MRLRMAASILTVLCAWVLWEKGEEGIQAVFEGKSLVECQKAMRDSIQEKETIFKRTTQRDSQYNINSTPHSIHLHHGRDPAVRSFIYNCLPPTVDPYYNTR